MEDEQKKYSGLWFILMNQNKKIVIAEEKQRSGSQRIVSNSSICGSWGSTLKTSMELIFVGGIYALDIENGYVS